MQKELIKLNEQVVRKNALNKESNKTIEKFIAENCQKYTVLSNKNVEKVFKNFHFH